MGSFKIEISGLGNHCRDRNKAAGEVVDFFEDTRNTPDARARELVLRLQDQGVQELKATITHWPASPEEISDDLVTGIRDRSILDGPRDVGEIMQFFSYGHLPEYLQKVSKPFCELAWRINNNGPSSTEMKVALRKLLEAKDAAVRAVVANGE